MGRREKKKNKTEATTKKKELSSSLVPLMPLPLVLMRLRLLQVLRGQLGLQIPQRLLLREQLLSPLRDVPLHLQLDLAQLLLLPSELFFLDTSTLVLREEGGVSGASRAAGEFLGSVVLVEEVVGDLWVMEM
jgi:hypothetical protein